jgi:hypothetical protein
MRRPITDPDELARLNHDLMTGLLLFQKGIDDAVSIWKGRPGQEQNRFRERIDDAIAEARGHVDLRRLARILRGHADALEMQWATTAPVEAARVPTYMKTGGNGNVVERVVAVLRGEQ